MPPSDRIGDGGVIRGADWTFEAITRAGLHPAAARSVLAHLIHMTGNGRLAAEPGERARYSLP